MTTYPRRHETIDPKVLTPENVIGAFLLAGIIAEKQLPDASDPAMLDFLVKGANLHLRHDGLLAKATEADIITALTELTDTQER
ncbi:hypothetical protein KDA06_02545 [Candidatus Saccharibacteria bacterium]|nr:hypothetical protein [Candidatus Saccharibacteria bacterium]